MLLPRNKKQRCCRALDFDVVYKPVSIPMSELSSMEIGLDEFEAMRLCDYDGMNQQEAALKMGISRGTVQRLLSSGRKKLLTAFLTEQAILIATKKEDD